MRRNVGTLDQALRVLLGLVVLSLGLVFESWWFALGLIPLVTGLAGRCPFYSLVGWSTCRTTPHAGGGPRYAR